MQPYAYNFNKKQLQRPTFDFWNFLSVFGCYVKTTSLDIKKKVGFDKSSTNNEINFQFNGLLLVLRQFLAAKSPLKVVKNVFFI